MNTHETAAEDTERANLLDELEDARLEMQAHHGTWSSTMGKAIDWINGERVDAPGTDEGPLPIQVRIMNRIEEFASSYHVDATIQIGESQTTSGHRESLRKAITLLAAVDLEAFRLAVIARGRPEFGRPGTRDVDVAADLALYDAALAGPPKTTMPAMPRPDVPNTRLAIQEAYEHGSFSRALVEVDRLACYEAGRSSEMAKGELVPAMTDEEIHIAWKDHKPAENEHPYLGRVRAIIAETIRRRASSERAKGEAREWIDVEKLLPPKFTEVLIAFSDCTLPATGQYTGNLRDSPQGWCYPAENHGDGFDWTITHWMPLPLTPNELAATPPPQPDTPAPAGREGAPEETQAPIRTGGSLNIPDVVRRVQAASAPADEVMWRLLEAVTDELNRIAAPGVYLTRAWDIGSKFIKALATPPKPVSADAREGVSDEHIDALCPDIRQHGNYSDDEVYAFGVGWRRGYRAAQAKALTDADSIEFVVVQDGCEQHAAPTLAEAQTFADAAGPWAMSIYEVRRRLVSRNGVAGALASSIKEKP